ncbi:LysR substrate-binding domain-containing protein [Aliagarivorans marinus]|uniref:LysR substrate-binding domain-containing protein n=1 Tax=Aliagarivorans marinus TaxID=561965 RepID=UPI0004299888|nr:LysR substrate-binding domain-containing protein [Aliagarivorans marinus]
MPDNTPARRLPPFNALRAFEAAARLGSLSGAANELHVSRAAVSQQVKQLEDYLGATLFVRQGSQLRLTEQGEQYLPLLSETLDRLNIGTQQLFGKQPNQVLRLRAAHSFCHCWLLPRLADFRRQHPDIQLCFTATSHPSASVNQAVDLEIINGYGDWQGKQALHLLKQEPWIVVASPGFAATLAPNATPEQLATADKIMTSGYTESWQDWFALAGISATAGAPSLIFDSTQLSLEACKQGHGLLLVKALLADDAIQQGELVQVHSQQMCSQSFHYLLTATEKTQQHKVIAFTRWLSQSLE